MRLLAFSFVPRSRDYARGRSRPDARLVRQELMLGHFFPWSYVRNDAVCLEQGAHLPGEGLPTTRRVLRPQGHCRVM